MFCKYCGKELKDDAVYCPYCGRNQKTTKMARRQKSDPRESEAVRASVPTPDGEPEAVHRSDSSSTGFTFRDPDAKESDSESMMPEEETISEKEIFEEEEETSEEDMQRYAAMKQKAAQDTASFPDQPFDSNESVQRIFGGGVFLFLTVLLTLYIPLHLAGTQSMLTFLLTIPTIIICIGCWIVFAECHRKQMSAGGLTMISGGLVAQVTFFLVEGIALAVIAFYSFYINFLYQIGDILDRLRLSDVSSGDLYMKVLPLVLVFCALLIACGAFLCHALRLIRRGAFSAKRMVRGETAGRFPAFRLQRTMGFVFVALACYVVKLIFSYGVYVFLCILLIPYQAIAEGLMESWFGISGGNLFTHVRNVMDQATGTSNLSELKEFFLDSFSINGTERVAGVIFILVLVCIIILLLQMRRNFSRRN